MPAYDQRKALLARDPLACAEGFRVLVLLTLRKLFGVRFCPRCPECADTSTPCADAFGSNATGVGGIFGRVDSVYGSIECQKSGSLHLHMQLFVQCFHQFTPLSELLRLNKFQQLEMLRKYSSYTAHVRRMVYCNPKSWQEEQEKVEEEWPEYKDSRLMISRPSYQTDSFIAHGPWKDCYLREDVELLQQRKQHHVHLPTGPDGKREPLTHCRDKKDSSKCKAGFPRDDWLTEDLVLICPNLADDMNMPSNGKRSMSGLLWGPVNDANLNGTHPALLAALRCNSDVQLPYRFPVTEVFHSDRCRGNCDLKVSVFDYAKSMQVAQAAQAGYGADYQNKRYPIARHEVGLVFDVNIFLFFFFSLMCLNCFG